MNANIAALLYLVVRYELLQWIVLGIADGEALNYHLFYQNKSSY